MDLELDKFAHIDSSLRRWDARWKLAAGGVFVIATVVLDSLPLALLALASGAGLVLVGRLPWSGVLARLKPVGVVVLAIAGLLAFTAPGERVGVAGLPLSRDGLITGGLVGAKTLAIVLTLVALVSSSPAQQTWAAMRKLHVPAGLVQIFHLAYRYVFVIHSESRAVQTAMRARGFRARLDGRSLSVLGNAIGMLLIRSTERAERVYLAMQARGFDGSFPSSEGWQTRRSDILKFALVAAAALTLPVVDTFFTRG